MMKDDKMKYNKIKQQLPYSKLVMADPTGERPKCRHKSHRLTLFSHSGAL